MAEIVSVSRMDLAGRRQKLRRHRQMKILQAIWRTLAISGLAGGLLWLVIQPIWVLNAPTQIVMKSGNQLLTQEAIKSLVVLTYPQSLWRIEPSAIANSLKQEPMIAQATVSRRLFPPGLIIEIKERVPVAMAQMTKERNSGSANKQVSVGLLDASGVWIPLEKYTSVNSNAKLPSLSVIGSPQQYRSYWTELYPAVSQSSVKITEIDFQDPTNVILKTELGNVHLGATSSQFNQQIKLLAQMRYLPDKLNSSQIEYIDIKNPATPLVQMNQNKSRINSRTP